MMELAVAQPGNHGVGNDRDTLAGLEIPVHDGRAKAPLNSRWIRISSAKSEVFEEGLGECLKSKHFVGVGLLVEVVPQC